MCVCIETTNDAHDDFLIRRLVQNHSIVAQLKKEFHKQIKVRTLSTIETRKKTQLNTYNTRKITAKQMNKKEYTRKRIRYEHNIYRPNSNCNWNDRGLWEMLKAFAHTRFVIWSLSNASFCSHLLYVASLFRSVASAVCCERFSATRLSCML